MDSYEVKPIGFVRSPITDRKNAPRQAHKGAPEAWIEVLPEFKEALDGTEVGAEIEILTWLHLGRRETLEVHPGGTGPLTGVFATRSPDRPNPIGLHRAKVLEIEGTRFRVSALEVVDGTPVVDLKPVLCP